MIKFPIILRHPKAEPPIITGDVMLLAQIEELERENDELEADLAYYKRRVQELERADAQLENCVDALEGF